MKLYNWIFVKNLIKKIFFSFSTKLTTLQPANSVEFVLKKQKKKSEFIFKNMKKFRKITPKNVEKDTPGNLRKSPGNHCAAKID